MSLRAGLPSFIDQRVKREGPHPLLFVSHEATRTGAPIFLWTILDWLRNTIGVSFEVLLLEEGELANEFKMIAPTSVANLSESSRTSLVERGLRKLKVPAAASRLRNRRIRRSLRRVVGRKILYLNSAISAEILPHVTLPSEVTVIVHVHELDFALEFFLPEATRRAMLQRTDLFIAASDRVREGLLSLTVPGAKIRTIHECLRHDYADDLNGEEVARLRSSLQLNRTTHVVGGSGMIEWRKGPDLFIQLGHALRKNYPEGNLRLLWLGGFRYEQDHAEVLHAIRHSNLEDIVTILPPVKDPRAYYALFDVFALTSREDPYPIVCLEAASLGKPIVCFESSGISEFVLPDCGATVPHLDVDAMALEITRLLEDDELRMAVGRAAALKAKAHDVSEIGPRIKRIIDEFLV